ncbi:MAG: roadblock/LC7 domain-containing protein [Nitrospinae bacterium]|nr:roadblock/LC7 domain-containing protein [Nitrospinota bacterium]
MSGIGMVLKKICAKPGVTGALVCGHDGLVVESALGERFDPDALSALASAIDMALANTCTDAGFGKYSRFLVSANNGGMIITDLGRSLFVVVTDSSANVAQINVEVFQASNEIKKQVNLG